MPHINSMNTKRKLNKQQSKSSQLTVWAACFALAAAIALTSAGCSSTINEPGNNVQQTGQNTAIIHAEQQQGDFIYRLYTDKKKWMTGDTIKIIGELEYTGEQEEIEIAHSASPFMFPLKERNSNQTFDYLMQEIGLTTVLKKDEPIRGEILYRNISTVETGKMAASIREKLKQNTLPAGFYEVNGYADIFVKAAADDESGEPMRIKASISFEVGEK